MTQWPAAVAEGRGRCAIYARVSTKDKDQDPATQLLPLREYLSGQGWQAAGEYIDQAPAGDLAARAAWRQLMQAASRGRIDVVLVFRLDRAFRSVLHAAETLDRSYPERPF